MSIWMCNVLNTFELAIISGYGVSAKWLQTVSLSQMQSIDFTNSVLICISIYIWKTETS